MTNSSNTVLSSLLMVTAMVPTGWAALPGPPSLVGSPGQYDDVAFNGKVLAQVAKDLPPGKVGATLVCLNGYQFALGAMLGINTGTPAVSIVQVHEAHQGGTRPATCQTR